MRPDPRARGRVDQARPRTPRGRRAPGLALALLAAALVSACSRADPIEQARLVAGRPPTSTLPPVPGAGEPYPNLGSVPSRPETTSPAARQALANALVADRANARYVGQPAAPAVPRGQPAEPPARVAEPAAATSPMLLGAEQQDALPMAPPTPAPPPIAGAPPPAAGAAVAQAPPPSASVPPSAPLPPAGRAETAAIAPISVEPLSPPPPPAMPDELPARARAPEPAPVAPPRVAQAPASPDPPPVLLPAEPRQPAPAAAPTPPPARHAAPPEPVQPAVVVDRTVLQPLPRRGPPETGYALAFLPGTATIVSGDLAILASLAARGRGAGFRITGFADAAGEGRALDLPLARARAVADALRAAGVPAEQIELGGSARPGPAGRGAEVRLVYSR